MLIKLRGLEIGGERHPAYPEYDQVDNVPDFGANIICDARKLLLEDRSYDHVYARNVLEHFSWRETQDVVNEWWRVVDLAGMLEIIVPDIVGIICDYQDDTDDWMHTVERIAGTQDYPGNTHLAFFTLNQFKRYIPEDAVNYHIEQSHRGGGITVKVCK